MKPRGSQFKWLINEDDSDAQYGGATQENYYLVEGGTSKSGKIWEGIKEHGEINTVVRERSEPKEYTHYWKDRESVGYEAVADYDTSRTVRESALSQIPMADRKELNPRLQKALEHETVPRTFAQTKLFNGGDVYPANIQVNYASFTEKGSKRFGEAMGMIKNRADEIGADIYADSSLSSHSGPLVNRLADAGLVKPESDRRWTPSDSNGMSFRGRPLNTTRFASQVPDEIVQEGRDTIRGVARQMNAQRRASRGIKGEQRLFEPTPPTRPPEQVEREFLEQGDYLGDAVRRGDYVVPERRQNAFNPDI